MTIRISFLLICLSCVFGIVFSNCQSESAKTKNAEKYFINYYVRFLESDQLTQATAQIRQGKDEASAIIKEIDKGVYFQKDLMKYFKVLKAPEYRGEKKGAYIGDYTFKFKGKPNKEYQSAIRMESINSPNITGPVSKSGQTKLEWQGKALEATESLVLMIND